jgi:hypothetical protein
MVVHRTLTSFGFQLWAGELFNHICEVITNGAVAKTRDKSIKYDHIKAIRNPTPVHQAASAVFRVSLESDVIYENWNP